MSFLRIDSGIEQVDIQPLGNAWSRTRFSAGLVNFFRSVVRVRRTRMMKRGSMLVTDLPMRLMLFMISRSIPKDQSVRLSRREIHHLRR